MMWDSETIDRLRADTPGCEAILHFDNAGASLMPAPVFDAVVSHLELERAVGGYAAEQRAAPALRALYDNLARLLRVSPSEIAFAESATRAWDMAFYALPLVEGDRILTHSSEYVSNYLALLQLSRRRGVIVDVAPSDSSGQVDIDELRRRITPRTRLLAITHVPTHGGLVNPAGEIGKLAREFGLLYLLDACQSAGQMDLEVPAIGCHMLSGTGRKFLRGPRGTGFLYVADGIVDMLDPPFVDLRSARWVATDGFEYASGARRFEAWESSMALRLGLSAAVGYALKVGLPSIEERVRRLAEQLRGELAELHGVAVRDEGVRKSGIVTFEVESVSANGVARALADSCINISVSPLEHARLDFNRRGIAELARASVHYFNTEAEIERFCRAVAGCRPGVTATAPGGSGSFQP
jgi:selenocysteine lyase/cysteine desulfurase